MKNFKTTIAQNAQDAAAVAIGDFIVTAIAMPAAWDAATLSFKVSLDGGTTWLDLYDSAGSLISFTVGANRLVAVDPTLWIGVSHVRPRASAAQTTGARQLTLVCSL